MDEPEDLEPPTPESEAGSDRESAEDLAEAFDDTVRATGDPMAALEQILRRPGQGRDPMELRGATVGGCRLVRLLGVGGSGATYAAFDAQEQAVAVKVVGPLDIRAHQRFLTECAILQQLKHPAVVRYRAHGLTDDELGYLVMELVEGPDLLTVLEFAEAGDWTTPVVQALTEGCTTPLRESNAYRRRILRMLATIAEALHEAHGHDIVHRDVKPANILVDGRLQPRLIDFGLGLDLLRHRSLTRSGLAVGTLAYMAPEQWRSDDKVGAAADIFSLGLVAFRCLTGRDMRANLGDLTRRLRRSGFFRQASVAHLTRAEQAVLYKALQAEPRHRYRTALDMARDLRAILAQEPVSAAVPSALARGWSRWGRAVGVVAVPAVLLVALLFSWFGDSLAHDSLLYYALTGRAPEGTGFLQVDAFQDLADATVNIDAAQCDLAELQGFAARLLEHGGHTVEWRSDRDLHIKAQAEVQAGYNRLTLFNVPLGWKTDVPGPPDKPRYRIHGGTTDAFAGPGIATVDREEVSLDGLWQVAESPKDPIHHVVEVRRGALVETQRVELRGAQLNYMWLLGGAAADTSQEWDYRRTLGSVFSPVPDDLMITRTGAAVAFLNHDQDKHRHGTAPNGSSKGDVEGYIQSNTAATSPFAGVEGTYAIRVEFPEAVAKVLCRTNCTKEGVTLEYRLGEGGWIPAPTITSSETVIINATVSSPGVETFEVRATFLPTQYADGYAKQYAFQAMMDMQDATTNARDPAFSIAAMFAKD